MRLLNLYLTILKLYQHCLPDFGDPGIEISANALPHDIARGMEAGFFRYITKPLKLKEFMAALDAALVIGEAVS